jgi:DNA adenine methylase
MSNGLPINQMPITALAPWAGAKRNLAGTIVEMLGKHRVFWDLFCGSMAIILAKEPCVLETAVDLHGGLTNLARVLQAEELALRLYEKLNRTLMSESLFADAAARYRERGYDLHGDEPDLDRAYDYFLCAWLGRNGCAGTQSYNQGFCVRYTANGGHAAKRWRSAIASIPAWHWRLMNVTILRRDVFEVIERIPDENGTAIYADPPYLTKGFRYVHDLQAEDHERLAGMLRRFHDARVVVSYYDDPRLQDLYPGWTMHKIEVSKAIAMQGSRGKNDRRATEVLLVNQPDDGPLFSVPSVPSVAEK